MILAASGAIMVTTTHYTRTKHLGSNPETSIKLASKLSKSHTQWTGSDGERRLNELSST